MSFLQFRKKKLPKGPSTSLEMAEKREKRVLIQMTVLVFAFLLFWLPFWIFLSITSFCHLYIENPEFYDFEPNNSTAAVNSSLFTENSEFYNFESNNSVVSTNYTSDLWMF